MAHGKTPLVIEAEEDDDDLPLVFLRLKNGGVQHHTSLESRHKIARHLETFPVDEPVRSTLFLQNKDKLANLISIFFKKSHIGEFPL
jgi:hypothetical protein